MGETLEKLARRTLACLQRRVVDDWKIFSLAIGHIYAFKRFFFNLLKMKKKTMQMVVSDPKCSWQGLSAPHHPSRIPGLVEAVTTRPMSTHPKEAIVPPSAKQSSTLRPSHTEIPERPLNRHFDLSKEKQVLSLKAPAPPPQGELSYTLSTLLKAFLS